MAAPDKPSPATAEAVDSNSLAPPASGSVTIPIHWLAGGGVALAVAVGAVLVLAWPKPDATKGQTPPRLVDNSATKDTRTVPVLPDKQKGTNEPKTQPVIPQQVPQLLPPPNPQPQQQTLPTPQPPLPQPLPNVVPATAPTNHAEELTDWGVTAQLDIQENIGSPTPLRLPGGRRITTGELPAIAAKAMLIDVLDSRGHATLPGAVHMPGGGNYGRGRYNDSLQRNLANALAKVTNRDPNYTLVFFCQGAQCWESYNAALRAIHMGYRDVVWYRGGLASWKAAGHPLQAPIAVYRIRG